jgi:hypothetical protein
VGDVVLGVEGEAGAAVVAGLLAGVPAELVVAGEVTGEVAVEVGVVAADADESVEAAAEAWVALLFALAPQARVTPARQMSVIVNNICFIGSLPRQNNSVTCRDWLRD